MATTADVRNGMCLELEGQYYFIVEFLHVKPGKGPAFVRTKLKNVTTGRILDKTFNAGVKVDEVRIERRPFQYLYRDDMGYNFMNSETFEQVSIPAEQIDGVEFLKEGDIWSKCKYMRKAERYLDRRNAPINVISRVTIPTPASKADTATNTLKHCNAGNRC
jgi:elongation factor P